MEIHKQKYFIRKQLDEYKACIKYVVMSSYLIGRVRKSTPVRYFSEHDHDNPFALAITHARKLNELVEKNDDLEQEVVPK